MGRRGWMIVGGALAVALVVLIAVPIPDPGNPPVRQEPTWDSPRTRELAARACFDCHSNETRWPFYSSIPPVSWFVRHHVSEAREVMNFSEWNREYEHADDAPEEVEEGEMPLASYLWIHREARLTPAETEELVAGLERTVGERAEQEATRPGGADEEQFEHRGEEGERDAD